MNSRVKVIKNPCTEHRESNITYEKNHEDYLPP